jgi:hypothetical protein
VPVEAQPLGNDASIVAQGSSPGLVPQDRVGGDRPARLEDPSWRTHRGIPPSRTHLAAEPSPRSAFRPTDLRRAASRALGRRPSQAVPISYIDQGGFVAGPLRTGSDGARPREPRTSSIGTVAARTHVRGVSLHLATESFLHWSQIGRCLALDHPVRTDEVAGQLPRGIVPLDRPKCSLHRRGIGEDTDSIEERRREPIGDRQGRLAQRCVLGPGRIRWKPVGEVAFNVPLGELRRDIPSRSHRLRRARGACRRPDQHELDAKPWRVCRRFQRAHLLTGSPRKV